MIPEPTQSSTLSPAAVELLWRGNVIEAIKLMHAERNLGLKEAKDLVDAYIRSRLSLRQKTVGKKEGARIIISSPRERLGIGKYKYGSSGEKRLSTLCDD